MLNNITTKKEETTMMDSINLTFAQMVALKQSHVQVSQHVFMLLADKNEVEHRASLLECYGGYRNLTLFSDGSAFLGDEQISKESICWVSTTMRK